MSNIRREFERVRGKRQRILRFEFKGLEEVFVYIALYLYRCVFMVVCLCGREFVFENICQQFGSVVKFELMLIFGFYIQFFSDKKDYIYFFSFYNSFYVGEGWMRELNFGEVFLEIRLRLQIVIDVGRRYYSSLFYSLESFFSCGWVLLMLGWFLELDQSQGGFCRNFFY